MNADYDVAIIGGGPAGSTAATLLAKKNRRVIVLEREKFPRFHIGESLLPFTMSAFDRLGVRKKLDAAGFVVKWGAEIISGCGEREVKFYFKDGFRPPCPTAFQVTRSEFDKILLDHASTVGAEVSEETIVQSVDFGSDYVTLSAKKEAADPFTIQARYLLDCSGRNSLVGTHFDLKRSYPGLKKFAVYAHYENVFLPEGIDGTLTRMVRSKDKWFWMIPLSRTKVSIGLVMDTAAFRDLKLKPEEVLEQSIQEQPKVRERMQHAHLVSKVYASSDYSYRNHRLHGDRWLLAGDAAGFIDPVFSSGIFIAVLSGEKTADILDRALTDEKCASRLFSQYTRSLNRVMDLYLHFVQGWYRQEFAEMLMNPADFLQIVPAVNAVLAGNDGTAFALKWRLWVFDVLVFLQRYTAISPRLTLLPSNA
ncbi:MAG: NAD(P)/FAD-dependent oxidoreductase [Chthoniobacterales bacterium]